MSSTRTVAELAESIKAELLELSAELFGQSGSARIHELRRIFADLHVDVGELQDQGRRVAELTELGRAASSKRSR